MARGPGKYDEACRALQAATEAEVIVILVVNGNVGSGFSVGVDADLADPRHTIAQLPTMLRQLAASLEQEPS